MSTYWFYALPALVLVIETATRSIGPAGTFGALLLGYWLSRAEALPGGPWIAGVTVGTAAFAAHLIPGFDVVVLSQRLLAESEIAVRLHPDKALLGALLLAWWLGSRDIQAAQTKRAWLAATVTLACLPTLAVMTHVIGWAPKWPLAFWPWFANNLLVTCVTEELFFRALLQRWLSGRFGVFPGICVASALFGLAHAPAGVGFAIIAGLAGLGYGAVFHYSGNRLWPAVALHGAVNSAHLLLLEYPY